MPISCVFRTVRLLLSPAAFDAFFAAAVAIHAVYLRHATCFRRYATPLRHDIALPDKCRAPADADADMPPPMLLAIIAAAIDTRHDMPPPFSLRQRAAADYYATSVASDTRDCRRFRQSAAMPLLPPAARSRHADATLFMLCLPPRHALSSCHDAHAMLITPLHITLDYRYAAALRYER